MWNIIVTKSQIDKMASIMGAWETRLILNMREEYKEYFLRGMRFGLILKKHKKQKENFCFPP